MGYPSDLLSSRAVVKPGMYAIIPPEGRVFNVIPGIEGCRMTILCTPKMGAGFVQHIGTALPGGGTTVPYGASGQIETFIYVLDGEGSLTVTVGGRTEVMPQGGYAYAPAGVGISFRNGTYIWKNRIRFSTKDMRKKSDHSVKRQDLTRLWLPVSVR